MKTSVPSVNTSLTTFLREKLRGQFPRVTVQVTGSDSTQIAVCIAPKLHSGKELKTPSPCQCTRQLFREIGIPEQSWSVKCIICGSVYLILWKTPVVLRKLSSLPSKT
ncbi:MAG: hypothetical protein ABI430_04490 [Candidatus Taylorbacteria bacterium]